MEHVNPNKSLIDVIRKIDFLIFFLITITFTWTGWYMLDAVIIPLTNEGADFMKLIFEEGQFLLIFISLLGSLSIFGPAISSFIVTAILDGKEGVFSLSKKIINWKVHIFWYLIALVIPIVAKYSGYIFNDLFLGGRLDFKIDLFLSFSFIFVFYGNLIPSGGQEEIGWIGFVQLRLQERYGVIQATLIKILMGWVWHLPLYLVFPWVGQYGLNIWIFLYYYIPIGFIYTWLFNNTDSILIPALLHAAFNTVGIHAITIFTSLENVAVTEFLIGLIMYIFVGFLFLKYGKNLTKKSLPRLITPSKLSNETGILSSSQ